MFEIIYYYGQDPDDAEKAKRRLELLKKTNVSLVIHDPLTASTMKGVIQTVKLINTISSCGCCHNYKLEVTCYLEEEY